MTLFISGLAVGVWFAVAYTLTELPFGAVIMFDDASLCVGMVILFSCVVDFFARGMAR